jgi:hypothetical protein
VQILCSHIQRTCHHSILFALVIHQVCILKGLVKVVLELKHCLLSVPPEFRFESRTLGSLTSALLIALGACSGLLFMCKNGSKL